MKSWWPACRGVIDPQEKMPVPTLFKYDICGKIKNNEINEERIVKI